MKKIINGKLYNTETAELVGSYDNGYSCSDFRHESEDLYRKKTGEFFLHGEGGPMTTYAQPCGHGRYGGSAIVPLTTDEAKNWVEIHLSANTYISLFGDVEE